MQLRQQGRGMLQQSLVRHQIITEQLGMIGMILKLISQFIVLMIKILSLLVHQKKQGKSLQRIYQSRLSLMKIGFLLTLEERLLVLLLRIALQFYLVDILPIFLSGSMMTMESLLLVIIMLMNYQNGQKNLTQKKMQIAMFRIGIPIMILTHTLKVVQILILMRVKFLEKRTQYSPMTSSIYQKKRMVQQIIML